MTTLELTNVTALELTNVTTLELTIATALELTIAAITILAALPFSPRCRVTKIETRSLLGSRPRFFAHQSQ